MTSTKLTAFALGSALMLVPAGVASADAEPFAPGQRCEMDYDNSGSIDFGDVLHVMSNWGLPSGHYTASEQTGAPTAKEADFGFAQLLEVITHYGDLCQSIID
ncbi:MAG: hypothetical protein GY715_22035 [Planctomycetes bacterium]|nr:hypothetical protein [Planctomycetota bacterium]